ncbi:MAG: hypothetical protein RIC06_18935 [Cyclobacteriaceae bacterium]
MKIYLLLILLTGSSSLVFAQTFRGLDKSPMDAAYLPDNYAHDRDPGKKPSSKFTTVVPKKMTGRSLEVKCLMERCGDLAPMNQQNSKLTRTSL